MGHGQFGTKWGFSGRYAKTPFMVSNPRPEKVASKIAFCHQDSDTNHLRKVLPHAEERARFSRNRDRTGLCDCFPCRVATVAFESYKIGIYRA